MSATTLVRPNSGTELNEGVGEGTDADFQMPIVIPVQ